MPQQTDSLNLIVPLGTQVVIRLDIVPIGGGSPVPTGTVGEVIRTPADATHAYGVRFPDGSEASVRRYAYDQVHS